MTKKEVLSMSNSKLDKVVKIQGTKFDRKRKLSDMTVDTIKWLSSCGMGTAKIASKLNLNYSVVKYWSMSYDERTEHNLLTSHPHSGVDNITPQDRAQYKRKLVASGAHVIYDMSK